jgi:hypothetical protein
MIRQGELSTLNCVSQKIANNYFMAENNIIIPDGETNLSTYGLKYGDIVSMTTNQFDSFMDFIGVWRSNSAYYINILCLQGVKPVNLTNHTSSKKAVDLKLVENEPNQYNDVIIIRYHVDSTIRDVLAAEKKAEFEERFVTSTDAEKHRISWAVNHNHLGIKANKESTLQMWKDYWLQTGDNIHALLGTVNPGSGTKQMDFGQHTYYRANHRAKDSKKPAYPSLRPNTVFTPKGNKVKTDYTWAYSREQGKNYYTGKEKTKDNTGNIWGAGTNIHYGAEEGEGSTEANPVKPGEEKVGSHSTGCINIWGGNGPRYHLFLLTAYLHGWPNNPHRHIPVTIWPGIDFFKLRKKAAGAYGEKQYLGLPSLRFGTHDTILIDPNYRRMGWVEKLQHLLWYWGNYKIRNDAFKKKISQWLVSNPEPESGLWGRFSHRTAYLLRAFQYFWYLILKNANRDSKAKLMMEERKETICGPMTWRYLRISCNLYYAKYINNSHLSVMNKDKISTQIDKSVDDKGLDGSVEDWNEPDY